MATFNQQNQKVRGNQYNIGGDSIINIGQIPNVLHPIILEIENVQKIGSITSEIATGVKNEVEKAIIESKKPEPNPKMIIEKLNGAKTLIEGLASAGGLVKIIIEAVDMVRKFIP